MPETAHGSRGSLAQKSFELGVGLLDRVEVGRIAWQVTQCRARGFDGFTHTGDVMGCEVVETVGEVTAEIQG